MPIEQAASRWIVSDDPDEQVEQVERIRPYIDLGFTHLVFHAPGLDQVRFIEPYGKDVLPKPRALAATPEPQVAAAR
jgi:coenzyme F420-dependent glucose-6-phosphate dehydrogenase